MWAWGSNKNGQLGIRSSDVGSLAGGGGPGCASPRRVAALTQIIANTSRVAGGAVRAKGGLESSWRETISAVDRRGMFSGAVDDSDLPILQIAAAHSSTIMLCRPRNEKDGMRLLTSQQVNEVYQWGHGQSFPSRVSFNAALEGKAGSPRSGSSSNLAGDGKAGSAIDRFFGSGSQCRLHFKPLPFFLS